MRNLKLKRKKIVSLFLAVLLVASTLFTPVLGANQAYANSNEFLFSYSFEPIPGSTIGAKELVVEFHAQVNNTVGVDLSKVDIDFPATVDVGSLSDGKLRLQFANLDPNKESYDVTIRPGAVAFVNGTQADNYVIKIKPSDILPNFARVFYDNPGSQEAQDLLKANNPRDITVSAPGSPIVQINYSYLTSAQLLNVSGTVQEDVSKVRVMVVERGQGGTTNRSHISETSVNDESFNVGMAGVAEATSIPRDLIIEAFDDDSRLIARQTVPLSLSGSTRLRSGSRPFDDVLASTNYSLEEILTDAEVAESLINRMSSPRDLDIFNMAIKNFPNIRHIANNSDLERASSNSNVNVLIFQNDVTPGQPITLKNTAAGATAQERALYISGEGATFGNGLVLGDGTQHISVHLRNMTVNNGNLEIHVGSDGKAFLENVTVDPNYNIVIRSGGVNTIEFKNVVGNVIFRNADPVRLITKGTDIPAKMTLHSSSAGRVTVANQSSIAIDEVLLTHGQNRLTIAEGNVKNLKFGVNAGGSAVTVNSNAKVTESIDTSAATTVTITGTSTNLVDYTRTNSGGVTYSGGADGNYNLIGDDTPTVQQGSYQIAVSGTLMNSNQYGYDLLKASQARTLVMTLSEGSTWNGVTAGAIQAALTGSSNELDNLITTDSIGLSNNDKTLTITLNNDRTSSANLNNFFTGTTTTTKAFTLDLTSISNAGIVTNGGATLSGTTTRAINVKTNVTLGGVTFDSADIPLKGGTTTVSGITKDMGIRVAQSGIGGYTGYTSSESATTVGGIVINGNNPTLYVGDINDNRHYRLLHTFREVGDVTPGAISTTPGGIRTTEFVLGAGVTTTNAAFRIVDGTDASQYRPYEDTQMQKFLAADWEMVTTSAIYIEDHQSLAIVVFNGDAATSGAISFEFISAEDVRRGQ